MTRARYLLLAAVLSMSACATVREEQPCQGVKDPRYSCRAVPELDPQPVIAE